MQHLTRYPCVYVRKAASRRRTSGGSSLSIVYAQTFTIYVDTIVTIEHAEAILGVYLRSRERAHNETYLSAGWQTCVAVF